MNSGDYMEFIINNIETIINLISMIAIWILGYLSKKSQYINNNLIIIQNIVLGIISAIMYYVVTKDFNISITMSGIFAEIGYNLIHNIEKLIIEKKTEKKAKRNHYRVVLQRYRSFFYSFAQ